MCWRYSGLKHVQWSLNGNIYHLENVLSSNMEIQSTLSLKVDYCERLRSECFHSLYSLNNTFWYCSVGETISIKRSRFFNMSWCKNLTPDSHLLEQKLILYCANKWESKQNDKTVILTPDANNSAFYLKLFHTSETSYMNDSSKTKTKASFLKWKEKVTVHTQFIYLLIFFAR